jgi:glycosyltransferase involved in cell wall biosynthesis
VPLRVAVGGLPFFGRRLAGLLGGDGWRATYLETRAWQPRAALRALRVARSADVVYLVGGQIGRLSRPHLLRLALRQPIAMHWAGSDVLYARRVHAAGRVAPSLARNVTHWAGAPWLAEELRPLGVDARWLPHSWVDPPATLPPLSSPEESPLTVLTYLPEQRAAFYGAGTVLRLARALPEVQVLVAGARGLSGEIPSNLRCLGWVDDMAPLYARSHLLLRLPRHDGLSFMVQEALAFGRFAVWSYPFPGVTQATRPEDAIAAVKDAAERHSRGRLSLNEAGAKHVRERFSRARIRADLRAALAGTLAL